MCRIKNELDCRSTDTNLMNVIKKCRKISVFQKKELIILHLKRQVATKKHQNKSFCEGFANGLC